MRAIAAVLVLLATVVTALVGVRLHGENRRVEYQVWHEMRKRDSLAKQICEVNARIDQVFAPRALLEERERRAKQAALARLQSEWGEERGPDGMGEQPR